MSVKLTATLAVPSVPENQSVSVHLLIKMLAKKSKKNSDDQGKRMNYALILDRSGSMEGSRISDAKNAIFNFIDKMDDKDTVSLTSFAYNCERIFDCIPKPKAKEYYGIISRIEADGNTNLSGGYMAGFETIKPTVDKNSISRILLLSDGQANAGICDPQELEIIAGNFLDAGVSTSTIGIGSGFNETLMTKLAFAGGGNAHFINSSTDINEIFNDEQKNLKSIQAYNATIGLTPKIEGMNLTQVSGIRMKGDNQYFIGDLYNDIERTIILELRIPPLKGQGKTPIMEAALSYTDKKGSAKTKILTIESEVVDRDKFATAVPDSTVLIEVAGLLLGKAKHEAMKLADRHQFDEASILLLEAVEKIKKWGLKDQLLDLEINWIMNFQSELKFRREDFYESSQKKSLHYHSYHRMTGQKEMIMKAMEREYREMRNRRG